MNISSVGVTGFVNDRRSDVEFLKALHKTQIIDAVSTENDLKLNRKRNIDRLRYRTKSFQSYKSRKCNLNQRSPTINTYRRRRRQKCLTNSSLSYHSHKWHIKRIFMKKELNATVPTNNKKFGYKALERFAIERCVINDQSYYRCIVVNGGDNLIEILSQFMDNRSLLFSLYGSKNFKQELGEVTIDFHKRNSHPTQCIGVVYLSYTRNSDDQTSEQVCMWMHPCILDDVMNELLSLESSQQISVSECNHLSRIWLRGPKSINMLQSLIQNTQKLPPSDDSKDDMCSTSSLKQLLSYKHMNRIWGPRQVLAATLSNSNVTDSSSTVDFKKLFNCVDQMRSPEFDSKTQKISTIPLQLIRKYSTFADPRNKKSELSGWDIIVPKSYFNVIWQCMLFEGAMAIGSDELSHLNKGVGILSFPRDYLDSRAGRQYWTEKRNEVELKKKITPRRNQVNTGDVLSLLSILKNSSTKDLLTEIPDSLMIVRGSHYSSDFCPPPFDLESYNSGSLPSVTALSLPSLTLLNVVIRMTSRGLPLDLAEILRPLESDYEAWLQGCENRTTRRNTKEKSHKEPAMWKGHKLNKYEKMLWSYEGRQVIGFVTSGQKPHINNESIVIGVCSANFLNKMFVDSFGKYPHPQAHMLVLVRNVRSQWLRPALISIL